MGEAATAYGGRCFAPTLIIKALSFRTHPSAGGEVRNLNIILITVILIFFEDV